MKSLAEMNLEAIRRLYRELGVVNAVRFLKQFTVGFGDYTQERGLLFGKKSLDEIVKEIEKGQKSS